MGDSERTKFVPINEHMAEEWRVFWDGAGSLMNARPCITCRPEERQAIQHQFINNEEGGGSENTTNRSEM